MPRQIKRRSDAISRDAGSEPGSENELAAVDQDDDHGRHHRRRRRSTESPASSISNDDGGGGGGVEGTYPPETQAATQKQVLVGKLVRLALACEFSRTPLRRSDISAKIFNDGGGGGGQNRRQFKLIFEEAQRQLKHVFGMQLVELPLKEKTSLKDRRNQTTQTKAAAPNKSWTLVSVLPREYREYIGGGGNGGGSGSGSSSSSSSSNNGILHAPRAPSFEAENAYTGFYSLVVTLIYLNGNELTEQKLERYLARLNADTNTPSGTLDRTLTRMIREGYIDKKRETIGGEDQISYVVGPRGKVEVGARGVTGLVRAVYGLGAVEFTNGPKIEEAELEARLARSLGLDRAGAGAGAGAIGADTQEQAYGGGGGDE